MTDYDWIVVGSGLTGATFARRIAEKTSARVLVLEQRAHIGGNVFDSLDGNGVLVQRYGAHIFHTGSRTVFDFLSRFTSWHRYEHRVLAAVGDRLVPVPFNFTSLQMLLGDRAPALQAALLAQYPAGARVAVSKLAESSDPQVREVGEYVLDTLFRGYTAKQWGRPIEEIDPSVLARVPVALSHDDRYFRDEYQAIPADGYTAMVARMLDHPSITVALEVDGTARAAAGAPGGARVLWTGRIDAYFGYEFGALPYRSLRFSDVAGTRWRQLPVAVVNHPGNEPFTRVIDHSHFSPRPADGTTLTYEYPAAYRAGENEPFYPVVDARSRSVYEAYLARAAKTDVLFAGRLGDFRYYDMHQAVGRALTLADTALDGRDDPHQLARAARVA